MIYSSCMKYGSSYYESMRQERGWSAAYARERSAELTDELRWVVPYRAIAAWGLNNPFASGNARKVVLNEAIRNLEAIRVGTYRAELRRAA